MSSILNFIVDVTANHQSELIESLKKEAEKHDVGVWFSDSPGYFTQQYVEYIATPSSLIFDLADNTTYNNCEDLVSPWWYQDCGEELFEKHMRIIESFCSLCLQYATVVHFIMGTDGMMIYEDELQPVPSTLTNFVQDVKQRYERVRMSPPCVHYVFV